MKKSVLFAFAAMLSFAVFSVNAQDKAKDEKAKAETKIEEKAKDVKAKAEDKAKEEKGKVEEKVKEEKAKIEEKAKAKGDEKAKDAKESKDVKESKDAKEEAAKPAEVDMSKVSYCLGYNLASSLKTHDVKLDPDQIVKAINDVYADKEAKFNQDERKEILQNFHMSMMEKVNKKAKEEGEKNLKEAEAFLKKNKEDKDVKEIEAGMLQYKVINKAKDGAKSPTETSKVKVHYKGTFIDGKEFDSSYKRNEPTEFPVTGVIPGWTKALMKMKVGDKWQLFIHPQLAYGENSPESIPSNSLLIFEVELLDVMDSDAKAPAAEPMKLEKK